MTFNNFILIHPRSIFSFLDALKPNPSRNCIQIFFDRIYNERKDSEALKSEKRISISTVPSFVTGHLVPFGSPSSRSTTVWTCLPDLDLFHLCLVNLSCLVYPPFLCCHLLKLTCVLPLLLISLFISPWMHFSPVCWTWFVLMDFVFRSIYLLGLFWLDFWPSPLASLKPSAL